LLALGECSEHERRKVTILAKEKQILLVQSIDHIFRVMLNDVRIGEDGYPIVLSTLGSLDAIHAEASWKTGNSAKDGLEGF
jgi:hypothetical protein